MDTTLTEQQQKAAQLLAMGIRPVDVCRDCKVSARSLRRWRHQLPEFQAYVMHWRRKGEVKIEAKQEELAEVQAQNAKLEAQAYQEAIKVLRELLNGSDNRIRLGAAKELREAAHARDKAGGDERDFVALVMSGAAEAEAKGPLVETEPLTGLNSEVKH